MEISSALPVQEEGRLNERGNAGAHDDSGQRPPLPRAGSSAPLLGLDELTTHRHSTSGPSTPTRRSGFAASARTQAAVAVEMETQEQRAARAAGIRDVLREYFDPHVVREGPNNNEAAFEALIDDRTHDFLEMPGESAETIKKTFSKGAKIDWAAVLGRGFFGTMAFAGSARVLDANPVIGNTVAKGLAHLPVLRDASSNFNYNFAAGGIQGAADHVWNEALGPAMKNIQWFHAKPEELEGPMKDAKAAATRSVPRALGEDAAAIQAFRGRDALRMAAAVLGANAEALSWINAAGLLAAGAGYAGFQKMFDDRHHRTGPAYLLGRHDWKTQYKRLRDATWAGAAASGFGHIVEGGMRIAGGALSVLHTATEAPAITKATALAVGSAASTLASQAASNAVQGEPGATAAYYATSLATGVMVSAAWTTANVGTMPAVKAARDLGNELAVVAGNGAGAIVQTGVDLTAGAGTFAARQARAGFDAAGRAASTGADAVSRFARAGGDAATSAGAGALHRIGERASAAAARVTEGFQSASDRRRLDRAANALPDAPVPLGNDDAGHAV